jgi:ribosomal protein S13
MDNNNLLSKLKAFELEAKITKKKNINIDAKFSTLTDEEISLVLAHLAKKLRIENNLKQSEFSKGANLSSTTTYSNFEQTGKVSLINFIKIVRNFGRTLELENLLKNDISSVIDNANNMKKLKKRVR